MTRYEILNSIEDDLSGECMMDNITKAEMMEYLEDVENWLETAKNGDKYYACGNEYELTIEYELQVWQNEEQRGIGEPVYMTPTCSKTDLEAIKRECEAYDIESTGCIEIFEVDEEEPILHYENGVWTEVE